MKALHLGLLAASFLGVLSPAWGINKCTGPDGRVAYQESPCPVDSKGNQPLKTWVNKGYGQQATSGEASVQPNTQLAGPPEAKPILDLYRRWADAERLALSTSRVSLAGPAASLQALQREAEAMQVPACLSNARKSLVELVSKSSEAILQFLGKEEVTGMAYQIVYRKQLIPAFEGAVTTANCQQ